MQPRLRLTSGNGLKCIWCGVDIQRGKRGRIRRQCESCRREINKGQPKKWSCPTCGKQTVGRKRGQRYCSVQCRKVHEPNVEKKICLYCNAEFETPWKKIKYCCSRHGVLNWARKRSRPEYTCEWCAKPFYRKQKAKDQHRFCSRSCAFDCKRISGKYSYCEWKHCAGCSAPFKCIKQSQSLCDSCNWHKKVRTRHCGECGVQVERYVRFCGDCSRSRARAKQKARPPRKKSSEAKRKDRQRRRAIKRQVIAATVGIADVVAAHGSKCHICGKNVDLTLSNGSMSATLDHVVPLCLGGWHDLINLRVAHMLCNSKKSGNYIGQLMLFQQHTGGGL
jgi:hypothetical protein